MYNEDKIHDQCGVFGIYSQERDVARIAYYGLYGLQHRGQESAGIVVSSGKRFRIRRGMGLVRDVFKTDSHIERLGEGAIAVGHNRYSTTGSSCLCNAQPFLLEKDGEQIVIAHNGNLANSLDLKKKIKEIKLSSTTDSEIIAALLLESGKKTWKERFTEILPLLKGAYSLVVATPKEIFGIRDPFGVRPLVLGRLSKGWVLSSEGCNFSGIGAKFIREVKAGEVIIINREGPKTLYQKRARNLASCIFEYIYFARPDSTFNRQYIGKVRERCGQILALEAPALADMVMPIPDSGTAAAIGFANKSGIPFGEGVIQNRYIGRTFIQPDQRMRDLGIKIKFGPMRVNLKGKRIVVVDDSVVRGSTLRDFVALLRSYGARKVHLRIASPPITDPCFYGVDTPSKNELIAGRLSENGVSDIGKINEFLGADSLAYLSLGGLLRSVGLKKNNSIENTPFCLACLTGKYKIPIDGGEGKLKLENSFKRLAVLISDKGTGTNLQAIIDGIENRTINGKIVAVISDTSKALGLKRAKVHKLPIEICDKKEKLLPILKDHRVDYVCLAGWKQIIDDEVIDNLPRRILNIHPGVIPDTLDGSVKNPDGTLSLWNRGKLTGKAIENFFENKATYAGSSIHFVTKDFDFGPVLERCYEKILPGDTVGSLYMRLKQKENKMYINVLKMVCNKP